VDLVLCQVSLGASWVRNKGVFLTVFGGAGISPIFSYLSPLHSPTLSDPSA
jgi:hypothetical protein